jgi:mRNA interferase YafQ
LRTPISGAQFRRDVKLAQKRGKDMAKLREIILLLIEEKPLPARYKDHPLGGEWNHHRDCHIEPNTPMQPSLLFRPLWMPGGTKRSIWQVFTLNTAHASMGPSPRTSS